MQVGPGANISRSHVERVQIVHPRERRSLTGKEEGSPLL